MKFPAVVNAEDNLNVVLITQVDFIPMPTFLLTFPFGCSVASVAPSPCATGCNAISNPCEESKLLLENIIDPSKGFEANGVALENSAYKC